ncbi:MAG: hypothetical protein VKP72_06300 [bacterium]|nr:hypothetical protein [bacterium]
MTTFVRTSTRFAFAVSLALSACQSAPPTAVRNPGTQPPLQTGASEPSFRAEGDYVILSVADGEAVAVRGEVPEAEKLEAGFAAVFFTDARGRYMVVQDASGQQALISARVKPENGKFIFETPAVFPARLQVLPRIMLPGNRRLAGFGNTSQAGPIQVGIASSYVIECLRALSRSRGIEVDGVLARPGQEVDLLTLIDRTAEAISNGILQAPGDPEAPTFVAGSEQELANTFVSRFLAVDRPARDLCKAWFADPIRPLVTHAGRFLNQVSIVETSTRSVDAVVLGPTAVTVDGSDPSSVIVAEGEGWRLRKVRSDGLLFPFIGENLGDPTARRDYQLSPDGSELAQGLRIDDIREVRSDVHGNLAMTFNASPYISFLCRVPGTYFGRAMLADRLYRLGDHTPDDEYDDLSGYQDGPLAEARFRDPAGLCFDESGNLYVADRRNNRIRMIRTTGEVETLIGDGYSDAPVELGRVLDQPAGASASLRASLNRPLSVAWRRAGNNQELYIYDNLNNVIRRAVAPVTGSFRDGLVETYAGTVASGSVRPSDEATDSVRYYSDTGVVGFQDGPRRSAKFHFADNISQRQVFTNVWGGLALDAVRNRLYVTDTMNRAIRMIDLSTDQVTTVARHGLDAVDGDARSVQLSNALAGLTVLPDGSLLICDRGNHVVRRLIVD